MYVTGLDTRHILVSKISSKQVQDTLWFNASVSTIDWFTSTPIGSMFHQWLCCWISKSKALTKSNIAVVILMSSHWIAIICIRTALTSTSRRYKNNSSESLKSFWPRRRRTSLIPRHTRETGSSRSKLCLCLTVSTIPSWTERLALLLFNCLWRSVMQMGLRDRALETGSPLFLRTEATNKVDPLP